MRPALALLLCLTAVASAGLNRHRDLVVADSPGTELASDRVRVTYLGTNGYLLESTGTTLLVDPYFTRTSLAAVALNLRQKSSPEQVAWAQRRLPARIDAILVTHGHFDHLLDVPPLAASTRAKIIASPTGVNLARAAGARNTVAVLPGTDLRVARARIRVLPATHDCVFGRVPFPGTRHVIPPRPVRPSDWVCGEPLAFLIEMAGQRIYVDSGGTREVLPPASIGPVDLAIVGVALPDSRQRLGDVLSRLRPRYFLPTHQDHFFRPLQRGFTFGPMTDFGSVARQSRGQRLILLDYFKPWTLR